MKNTFDPLQVQDDSVDWDKAIEESQTRDIEWSLNDKKTEEKLEWYERALGTAFVVTVGLVLLPIAIPVYFFMKHLDDKYDYFCP